jgi:hypothetical protein
MKKIHGKILIIILILTTNIFANNIYCDYSIKSSKTAVKVNEAFYITFQTRQKLHNEVIFFDLVPHKDKDIEITLLNSKRYEYNYHDAEKTFTYLVFIKKAKIHNISFDFSIRRASDEAVAQAYVGSRDNVKSIPTIKVDIAKITQKIEVLPLKKSTDAVGEFKLSMIIDKTKSNSYDAINLKYKLTGKGYLDKNFSPLQEIKNSSTFSGIDEIKPIATKEGYIYSKEWSYAIISKESFIIKSNKLNIYNPILKKYEQIKHKDQHIKINPLNVTNLIDDKESPSSSYDYEKYIKYLYNILIFIAGFLTALSLKYIPKKESVKKECCELLKKSKTPQDALKALLPVINKKKLKEDIDKLEMIIYSKDSGYDFKSIKDSIIKKL